MTGRGIMNGALASRPALQLVPGSLQEPAWAWFCGYCGKHRPEGEVPSPRVRVCPSCGFGMLLETHEDQLPAPREPFLIVDLYLRVQGLSRRAESLLRVREDIVVGRPVTELLVAADAENSGSSGLVNAICAAASGEQPGRQPAVSVRPSNMHGVRMRARVTHCGPPLAALLVLESPDGPQIRLVEQ